MTPARSPSSTRSWHDSTLMSPVSRKPGWPTLGHLWKETTPSSANEYWQNLCAKIQLAADCGHTKVMYEGIKTATGPMSVKTAPLKSKTGDVITDQSMWLQQLGGALSRALLNPEHCHRHSPQCPAWVASHRGA